MKMSSDPDNHSALKDHLIGGYKVDAIMTGIPLCWRTPARLVSGHASRNTGLMPVE
jgi:hypothetical protein